MNTLQTDFRNEEQSIKGLFRELFLIQIQFEKYTDQRFYFNNEVKELIQRIDQLMQILIDLIESLES